MLSLAVLGTIAAGGLLGVFGFYQLVARGGRGRLPGLGALLLAVLLQLWWVALLVMAFYKVAVLKQDP